MMLVVWGSTESSVESKNVPPSTMAASFCGPFLAQAQFLLDQLDLMRVDLSQQSVGVTEQLRHADRDGGAVQRDDAAVAQIRSDVGCGFEVDELLARG